MIIIAVVISIALTVLSIMTMISIIGIRKELRIKNLYTRRTLIDYPYNIALTKLELDVYDYLYLNSPEWFNEAEISAYVSGSISKEETVADALNSLKEKGLIQGIDGLYSVKLNCEK